MVQVIKVRSLAAVDNDAPVGPMDPQRLAELSAELFSETRADMPPESELVACYYESAMIIETQ